MTGRRAAGPRRAVRPPRCGASSTESGLRAVVLAEPGEQADDLGDEAGAAAVIIGTAGAAMAASVPRTNDARGSVAASAQKTAWVSASTWRATGRRSAS